MSDLGWQHLTPQDKATILRGVTDGVAYGGPYHVELYPADRCNIDCFFCSTAALLGTDEIPMPRFEELLGELREAGTRSVRLAGGGEPLFHRQIKGFLRAIAASGIPIENLTTNGVLLRGEVTELLSAVCDKVTVSLNTGDAESYATMIRDVGRQLPARRRQSPQPDRGAASRSAPALGQPAVSGVEGELPHDPGDVQPGL